jgi:inner membrane protein
MMREKSKHSVGLKVIIIGGLIILLLIPTLIIQFIIFERESRRAEVLREVTAKWGDQQKLTGPILSIPVEFNKTDQYGNKQTCTRYIYLLPDSLVYNGELLPEIRYRSIFEILLYSYDGIISGNFNLTHLKDLDLKDGQIKYDQAVTEFGISDMKGVSDQIRFNWDGSSAEVQPGKKYCTNLSQGFHIKSPLEQNIDSYNFSCELRLNGNTKIGFTPLGKNTVARINAAWEHPGFIGDYLPNRREISQNRFTAEWQVLHLNRDIPQFTYNEQIPFDKTSFGVQLILPVDQYQKTMRTVKYAIMFIGLTFLAFFLIEILNGKMLHPIQYLLVGSGLVLFYILLLSLSEHLFFPLAYSIASLSLILLISLYSRAILRDTRFMLIISSVLTLLYGFLYVDLQLEDYALLLGSIGLFVILAVVMYLTRNLNWYNILPEKEAKSA